MPPNATSTSACTGVLNENDAETIDGGLLTDIGKLKKAEKRKLRWVWRNIIAFAYLHMAAVWGLWLALTSAKYQTCAFGEVLSNLFTSLCLLIPRYLPLSSPLDL